MSQSPPPPHSFSRYLVRFLVMARKPKTIAIATTSIALILLAYAGLRLFLKTYLPPWLEGQVAQVINRPIDIGELEGFSLTHLTLKNASIPATDIHKNQLLATNIQVTFNPLIVLFRQTLPITVSPQTVEVDIRQDQQGNWLILDVTDEPIPIDLDLTLDVTKVDVALFPQNQKTPIKVVLGGEARYQEKGQKKWNYNIQLGFLDPNEITVQGETFVKTIKSQVKVTLNRLPLPFVASLLPQLPLQVSSGKADADINLNLPSLTKLKETQGQGSFRLGGFQGKLQPLQEPIEIFADVAFNKSKVSLEQAQIKIGKILTRIQGDYDWRKGSNFKILVDNLTLNNIRQVLPISLPFETKGELKAQFKLTGMLQNPLLQGKIINQNNIQISKTSFKTFLAEIQVDLNQFLLQSAIIQPQVGGEIQAKGNIQHNLKKIITEKKPFDWRKTPFFLTFQTTLPSQSLINDYYQLPASLNLDNLTAKGTIRGDFNNPNGVIEWQTSGNLKQPNTTVTSQGNVVLKKDTLLLRNTGINTQKGNIRLTGSSSLKTKQWQVDVNADSVGLTNFANAFCRNQPFQCPNRLQLEQGNVSISGRLDKPLVPSLKIAGNGLLLVDQGRIAVNSSTQAGQLATAITALQLPINSFFSQLPVPVIVNNSRLNLLTDLTQVWQNSRLNLNSIQGQGNVNLKIAQSTVTASGKLQGELLEGVANLNRLSINQLLPTLPIPVNLISSEVKLQGNLRSLLFSDRERKFETLQIQAKSQLAVDQGTVNLLSELNNNQLQTEIQTDNISLSSFNRQFLTNFTSEKLKSKINASISLDSVLSSPSLLPITISQLFVQLGDQELTADGSIVVQNFWQNPDIQNLTLNLNSFVNFNSLSFTSLLDQIPIQRQFLPETFLVTGLGEFSGQLRGKNLLTAPFLPGNLEINGDLKLSNFRFNDLIFEPRLTGKVILDSQANLSLNLDGKQDKINAILTSCVSNQCLFPYSLQSFNVRQNYQTASPLIVQGNRQNDNLVAKVENFPLETLRINPLGNYGLPNYLEGKVNLDLDFNPNTSNLIGNLTIISPRFGKLIGNQLDIVLNYQNQELILEKTQLSFGESEYNIFGKVNFASGEIQSNLKVNNGNIQDILATLQVYNWESLLQLLQLEKPNFTTANQVSPNAINTTQESIAQRLNKFWEVSRIIQAKFDEVQTQDLPQELDFRGQFQAEINLVGTFEDPQVSLQFQGRNWQWTPQPSTASIIQPLGLVLEESQVIPIEQLGIKGKLEDGKINLTPTIQIGEAIVKGNLNLGYQNRQFYLDSSQFQVQNFTLDLVRNLIVIPSDVNGSINLQGVINGPLTQPRINGNFEFNEGVINARSLNQDINGQFIYVDNNLRVATTEPEFIQVSASIPFPIIQKKNDRFDIQAKITTPAFSLLPPLTLDQVIWVDGEGEITLNIGGRLSVNNQIKVALDPESQIDLNLNNATLTNPLLPVPLTVNGRINLQNRAITIQDLWAKLGERNITITGQLPLFANNKTGTQGLAINLFQNKINSSGIYQGLINGQAQITGALISPIISGDIRLSQGKLTVPNFSLSSENQSAIFEKWVGTLASNNRVVIPPQLNDLRLGFENITIERNAGNPNFFFNTNILLNLSGAIALNGQINSLSLAEVLNIRPSGQIEINSGKVNIPITRVFVSRQHKNTLTFFPEQGLLNPNIDLELNLYLFAVGLQSIKDNEVPDDIVQTGRAQSVEVTLKIQGSANEVLPNLGQNLEAICQLRPPNAPPIMPSPITSSQKLRQLAQCIEVNNLGTNSIADLLRSPIVSFSSNPPLNNSELLTLFNTQIPEFIDQLQRQNSSQLVEAGILQSAVVVLPFLQDLVFEGNEKTSDFGEKLGLPNLRLFPVVETVYELEDSKLIRFSYDYTLNEATIRYETRF